MNNMSASNPTLSIELAAATTKAQDISIDHLLVFVIHSKSFCIRHNYYWKYPLQSHYQKEISDAAVKK